MSVSIDSVNGVAAFLRAAAEKNTNPDTRSALSLHAEVVEVAASDLIRLRGLTSALPPDLGNVYDLPAELLEELSIAKTDELEDQLVTVINACGGEASLDQILVGLYRKFGVSQKRRFLQNKLYRMDMVWSVDGRKGFYTSIKPTITGSASVNLEVAGSANAAVSDSDLDDEIPF